MSTDLIPFGSANLPAYLHAADTSDVNKDVYLAPQFNTMSIRGKRFTARKDGVKKVLMKPGMPLLLAEGGTLGPALFLCLPGNPVSVLATWLALGRRLVDGLQGRAPRSMRRARLASAWTKRHERLEFLRGRWWIDDDGISWVEPNPADGSHRMQAAADSDALIVLDPGPRDYAAGTPVDVLPY